MKRPAAIGTLALVLLAAPAAHGSTLSNIGGTATDLANEKLIRELYKRFTEAWNRHDVAVMAGMWAIDGDHREPDGTVVQGKEAVSQLFTRQHATVFKETTLTLGIDHVWFISADVALVDGGYEVAGIRTPDGTELPVRKGHLTAVLLHEQNRWWIAASRLMIPAPLPYKK